MADGIGLPGPAQDLSGVLFCGNGIIARAAAGGTEVPGNSLRSSRGPSDQFLSTTLIRNSFELPPISGWYMLKTCDGSAWKSPGVSARIRYCATCCPRHRRVIAIETFWSWNSLRLYQ